MHDFTNRGSTDVLILPESAVWLLATSRAALKATSFCPSLTPEIVDSVTPFEYCISVADIIA